MGWSWLYMTLEAMAFLALSAVMWRVVMRADSEPAADVAGRRIPVGATVPREARRLADRPLELARR